MAIFAATACASDWTAQAVEAIEQRAHRRAIVDGEDRATLQLAHHHSQLLVLFQRGVLAVASGLPVRRIEEEQRLGPVVLFNAVLSGQLLDHYARQTHVGVAQILFESKHVDSFPAGSTYTERLALHLPAKAQLLEVVEPNRTLDVGQPIDVLQLCLPAHLATGPGTSGSGERPHLGDWPQRGTAVPLRHRCR